MEGTLQYKRMNLIQCLVGMTSWKARIIRIYLEIKWCLWRLKPKQKTVAQLKEKCSRDIEDCQRRCRHEQLSFRFAPWVICIECEKVVREATLEELSREQESFKKEIDQQIEDAIRERMGS